MIENVDTKMLTHKNPNAELPMKIENLELPQAQLHHTNNGQLDEDIHVLMKYQDKEKGKEKTGLSHPSVLYQRYQASLNIWRLR